MKLPELGFNKLQSFIEFFTTFGKAKFGLEGLRMFFESGTSKKYFDGKMVNQTFAGSVNLSNDLTHYDEYTVASDLEITAEDGMVVGGYAELSLKGNGSNTPTFASGFTATPGSDAFNNTLDVVNKVGVYYDGTIWYTITPIV